MILTLAATLAAAPPASEPAAPTPAGTITCTAGKTADESICRALAAQSSGRWSEAAAEFEAGAALLEQGDLRRDRMLAAAGNMWIAAGEPGKAALALDRALAGPGLRAEQRGEALLDRARAAEAQNDLKTAREKVTEAAATIGEQPFLWYFSAALAIREGNGAEAKAAINRALAIAPNDPLVLFEAGHVAQFNGDADAARSYWTRAVAADADGDTGKAAKDALALLDAPAAVQIEGQAPR